MAMTIKTFFDSDTATFTHIVSDPSTEKAGIIDSVLDYDQYSGRTSTKSADQKIQTLMHPNSIIYLKTERFLNLAMSM